MTEHFEFSIEERDEALALYTELKEKIAPSLEEDDEEHIRSHLLHAIEHNQVRRNVFGLNPIVSSLQTALLIVDEIGLRRDAVLAVLLNPRWAAHTALPWGVFCTDCSAYKNSIRRIPS